MFCGDAEEARGTMVAKMLTVVTCLFSLLIIFLD